MTGGATGPAQLLVVEDDAGQMLALTDRLTSEGYGVECARDGTTGLRKALERRHDLVLLDVMLPGKNGFDVCGELRSAGVRTPVLMLTARDQVTDKVVGLELGADDYLAKPFEFIELLARIRALLRRSANRRTGVVAFGAVEVDFARAEVRRAGRPVALAARELELLRCFVDHAGLVLSRNDLLDAVWGAEALPTVRTVDVHVARLRQKLEDDPSEPRYLTTVRGLGYKFTDG